MKPIILIGCGKKKCQRKARAEWMYQGGYYASCLSLARLLTERNCIFILSAKYGIIPLTKTIKPYNLKITDLSKKEKVEWEKKIQRRLKKWKGRTIIFVCGKIYHSNFKGIKLLPSVGIGKQLQWMKQKIKELKNVQNKKENGSFRCPST